MGAAIIPYCFGGNAIPASDGVWRPLRILGMTDAAEIYHFSYPFNDQGAIIGISCQKICAANETFDAEAVINNVYTGLTCQITDADQRNYAEQRKDLDQLSADDQISVRYQTANGNANDVLCVVYVQKGLSET